MNIVLKNKLKTNIKYDKEVEMYIAYAPALRLYSQGETRTQAEEAIQDAVQSYLIVAYRNGVLDKCLKNTGNG